ncbi:hypothetical protein LXA47_19215 [Massilia sp. P8910]|uniref:hypothetical protein n=1 Tax=Massilia antarctica TaxID=2765360 RepID=UPI001E54D56D|nr:hypothetical protein [Massilia antarctica]MCE3605718.1 hypothetical protein [Massilia antarctica]
MSPYRQEIFAEMFGWINEYPQFGKLALLLAVWAGVAVAVYELVQHLCSRGGKRAD